MTKFTEDQAANQPDNENVPSNSDDMVPTIITLLITCVLLTSLGVVIHRSTRDAGGFSENQTSQRGGRAISLGVISSSVSILRQLGLGDSE